MRRLVACAALLFVLGTTAGLFAPAASARCTDHVCACRRGAAPRPATSGACHEGAETGGPVSLQASCSHHHAGSGNVSLPDSALLPSSPSPVALLAIPLDPPPAPQPLALAPAPEAPPPRPASC